MSNSEQQSPVIIVGAGPTGLTMALFLERFNVPFRIIDQGMSSSDKSKALVVQARSLELFQQLGIDQKAIEKSHGISDFSFFSKGKKVGRIRLTDEKDESTPFPFAAIIPQDMTEKIMIEELELKGVKIEWNVALKEVRKLDQGVEVDLQKNDGSIEKTSALYLVGADGAHSVVRKNMNTDFVGGSYESSFMLTDVEVEWKNDSKGLSFMFEQDFFCLFFPYNDSNRYRIIALIPEVKEEADFDFLKNFLESKLSIDIKISEPAWTSAYTVHHRCVEHFREGALFLAGDAAHIHSPAGGQGMNTGIQDAHNLAWKLAMVIQGKADEKLLDTYHLERWRVAQHLVHGTDRGFKLMTDNHPMVAWVRNNIFVNIIGTIFSVDRLKHDLFHFISQTGINYEHHYADLNDVEHDLLKAGDRLPWCKQALGDGRNIYDLIAPDSYQVLLFDMGIDYDVEEVQDMYKEHEGVLNVHRFHIAEELDLFSCYHIYNTMFVLVRPDMHIACVGRDLELLSMYFVKELGWKLN
jgi:2-polyprenyl-6-methoxyphenol hydroxylase-like FAD-dependent oxidoreductase